MPSIKIQYGDDIRRVSVCESVTVAQLNDQVNKKFHFPAGSRFSLHYYDGEDLCLVSNNEELAESFKVAKDMVICLKFVVTLEDEIVPQERPQPEKPSPPVDISEEQCRRYFRGCNNNGLSPNEACPLFLYARPCMRLALLALVGLFVGFCFSARACGFLAVTLVAAGAGFAFYFCRRSGRRRCENNNVNNFSSLCNNFNPNWRCADASAPYGPCHRQRRRKLAAFVLGAAVLFFFSGPAFRLFSFLVRKIVPLMLLFVMLPILCFLAFVAVKYAALLLLYLGRVVRLEYDAFRAHCSKRQKRCKQLHRERHHHEAPLDVSPSQPAQADPVCDAPVPECPVSSLVASQVDSFDEFAERVEPSRSQPIDIVNNKDRPLDAVELRTLFRHELAVLFELGFVEQIRNLEMLRANGGDLQDTLEALLEEQAGQRNVRAY